MSVRLSLASALLVCCGIGLGLPATAFELNAAHQQLALECDDCHTQSPPTRMAPQKSCRGCHGDMKDAAAIEVNEGSDRRMLLNIHDTHAGDLRCTVCHAEHKPSVLYCNEACHHVFDLETP